MTLLGSLTALLLVAAAEPVVTQKVVGPMGNIFVTQGSFDVAAPNEVAWSVLTDYANQPNFLSDIKSSVIKEQRDGVTIVAQESTQKVAMFTATVQMLLTMKETRGARIVFSDTLGKDFDLLEGGWTLSQSPGGLHIDYSLRCRPRAKAPRFIVGPLMEDSTRRLMVAMRREIERRAVIQVAAR